MLITDRLQLREMTEADAENIYRLNSTEMVVRYVGEPVLKNVAEALEILRTRILPQYTRGIGRWACELRDGGDFIGWCGLKYMPDEDEYDLGYRFLEQHWGKGYATEAARAVLEYGRNHLPGCRIVGKAFLENVGSIRVLQKIGMRFEAYGREHDATIAIYVAL